MEIKISNVCVMSSTITNEGHEWNLRGLGHFVNITIEDSSVQDGAEELSYMSAPFTAAAFEWRLMQTVFDPLADTVMGYNEVEISEAYFNIDGVRVPDSTAKYNMERALADFNANPKSAMHKCPCLQRHNP
eukprot:SAG11_NODE_14557_length_608_cov_0.609037_1_plen_131_part_00